MWFTADTLQIVISDTRNGVNFNDFSGFATAPVTWAGNRLTKNIEIAVKSIAVAIHADKRVVKVLDFATEGESAITTLTKLNNVRSGWRRHTGTFKRSRWIEIVGATVSLHIRQI